MSPKRFFLQVFSGKTFCFFLGSVNTNRLIISVDGNWYLRFQSETCRCYLWHLFSVAAFIPNYQTMLPPDHILVEFGSRDCSASISFVFHSSEVFLSSAKNGPKCSVNSLRICLIFGDSALSCCCLILINAVSNQQKFSVSMSSSRPDTQKYIFYFCPLRCSLLLVFQSLGWSGVLQGFLEQKRNHLNLWSKSLKCTAPPHSLRWPKQILSCSFFLFSVLVFILLLLKSKYPPPHWFVLQCLNSNSIYIWYFVSAASIVWCSWHQSFR